MNRIEERIMKYRAWQLTLTHGFEVSVATCWFLVGVAWVANGSKTALRSPVGPSLAGWHWFWAVLYLVALPCVLYGVYRRHVAVRGFGLALLGTGLTGQCIAAVVYDWTDPRSYIYGLFAAFCFLKVHLLYRVHITLWRYEI
jgi:hypothetical protein